METTPNRNRTQNLVVRLSDRERDMLNSIAEHEQLTPSEMVRLLIRREHDAITPRKKTKKGAK